MSDQPHVVIIGGGFGGLNAARALAREPVRVTLIDRRNHHLFQPLLYQVATAGLSAIDIAEPIRRVLRKQSNARVLLADVSGIDLEARKVTWDGGELAFDKLIVAAGAHDSYFGHDQWRAHAPGLKSIQDALRIRTRILKAFERAELESDAGERARLLTFVVIGGGPTGVELAGAIAELARLTLHGEFRNFDPGDTRIVLLEAGDRILPMFDEPLPARAREQLEAKGVEVRTGAMVTDIDDEGVRIADERIEARTVLWAAGVAPSPLAKTLGVELTRRGQVPVEPDLSVPGHREAFVIGDLACLECGGKPVPALAPAAIQEGRHAAANIAAQVRGAPTQPFRYVDKGMMATIGRKAAVAGFAGIKLGGLLAWLMWLVVHIFFLIGFRNRIVVLFEWIGAYFTYRRSARLLIEGEDGSAGADSS